MPLEDIIQKSFTFVIVVLLLMSSTALIMGQSSAEGEVSAWPMFGGSPSNDGRTRFAERKASDDLNWNFTTRDKIDSSPALGPEGNIYVGSGDGRLYSINSEGEKNWSFHTSFLFSIEEHMEDIANNLDEKTISDNLRTGYDEENYTLHEDQWISISVVEEGEVWQVKDEHGGPNHDIIKENGKLNIYDAKVGIDSSPAVDAEGNVYFGDTNGYFYSLDSNGTERWSKDLGEDLDSDVSILSSPVVTNNGSVLIGRDLSMFYSFSLNGTKEWEYNPGGLIASTPAVDEDGRIYLGYGYPNVYGRVEVLSSEGDPIWNYTIETPVFSSPALDDKGNVYFGSHDGNLYSVDSEGKLNWRYETDGVVFSSPAIGADGTIYVGSNDNHLYAIEDDGEERWRHETGGAIQSSPSIGSSGNIYFGSRDGNLYSLTPDGEERWDFETDGRIFSSSAIDAEGNLYFGSADHDLYSLGTEQPMRYTVLYPLIIGIVLFIVVFVPINKKFS